MRTRRTAILWSLLFGIVVGGGYPCIDLVVACRVPASEACVWGKAYFPLSLGLSLVLLGGVSAGLLYAWLSWRDTRKGRGDDA
jgi:hypothetical protein